MSSDEIAIRVRDLSKHYLLFNRPQDRLKQSIVPRLQRLVGRKPQQYYRDFAALSRVSFDVKRGETVGMIGRNGSGKSTLLQIICGTLQPNSGTIEANGRIAALLELGAGFNPEFTGRENVHLNGAILGLQRREIDARFDDIARFADIGDFIDQPVKTYSSGMYVRLAFATAINVDPDILVVDEALAVGDEAFQRKCFARIEQIRERGGTILFVSHGAQTIVQLCDRAMLIDRGEVILEGPPKTVVSQYQRFVNLSGPEAEPVREEIKAMDGNAAGGQWQASGEVWATAGEPAERTDAEAEEKDHSWFDPNLVSQSRVEYESKGARIRDVVIRNARGEPVNNLQRGKTYVFEYYVDFAEQLRKVAFGIGIRTGAGIELAGATTMHDDALRLDEVHAGETVRVRFEFRCDLNPGTYFSFHGVKASSPYDQYFAHRIFDAIVLRIILDDNNIPTGFFDMKVTPHIEAVR